MPQMAPLLWLILFIYFVALFLCFIFHFYYVGLAAPIVSDKGSSKASPSLNWLW